MITKYNKVRYDDNLGYRILHVTGTNTGETALPYLHHCLNYMLLYFKQGTGSIKIEGRRYKLSDGDIVILNPSELFQLTIDNNKYHERMTLNVSEALLASFPDSCNSILEPFYKRSRGIGNHIAADKVKKHGMDICLNEILKYAQSSEETSPILCFCKIIELLSGLKNASTLSENNDNEDLYMNPTISEVLRYLNLHFKEELNISYIAEIFNIDKSHLSHLFKEHMGMSLWNYVIFRRIQLFNSLIRQNNSVEETCYEVGFKNYSNFFRLYKKHMKMTPTEFKKQIKSGEKIINIDSRPL